MKVTAFRYYRNGTGGYGYYLIRFRRGHRTRGEFTAIVFDDEPGPGDAIMAVFGPGGLPDPVSPDEWFNDIHHARARHELAYKRMYNSEVNDIREFGYAGWASKRVLDLINGKGGFER